MANSKKRSFLLASGNAFQEGSIFYGLLEKRKELKYCQHVSESRKYGIQLMGKMLLDREGDMLPLVKTLRGYCQKYFKQVLGLEEENAKLYSRTQR